MNLLAINPKNGLIFFFFFYFAHGCWRDETKFLGTAENLNVFKNVIDHAIQDKQMRPMIIAYSTYNSESPKNSGSYSLGIILTDDYHNELASNLVPSVESIVHMQKVHHQRI